MTNAERERERERPSGCNECSQSRDVIGQLSVEGEVGAVFVCRSIATFQSGLIHYRNVTLVN
jgi:hypothetical protein